jgi:sortase (surface protein transpeptidase)
VGPILATSTPVLLRIPAIGVVSPLISLGLNKDGSVEVPAPGANYDRAGWYRASPTPGALGPAVIIGHVDSATDDRSVFFSLGSLKPGARVEVSREDGIVAIFEIDRIQRYNKNAFPTELVYGNTNRAALRLITCGGPIDERTGHYRDNVIVWASLVGPTPTPTPMLEP